MYQYRFEVVRVNGKRKYLSKSGFKTKTQAFAAGQKAYDEYQNGGCKIEAYMSYSDYLDYWLENYCKDNLKHRTSYQLNKYIMEVCRRYDYSYGYFRNFVKVIKTSFRVATDFYGFINYNPAVTLKLPNFVNLKKIVRHIYTQEEIDSMLNRFVRNDAFTCLFITCLFYWNENRISLCINL